MRGALITLCVLLILAIAALPTAAVYVNGERDQVVYTPTHFFGDSSEVADVKVESHIHQGNHLFWDIAYTPGTIPEVGYDFYAYQKRIPATPQLRGLELFSHVEYGISMDTSADLNSLRGLELAYRQLYDATPLGGEASATIRLADYLDYYPISARLSIPDMDAHWNFGGDIYTKRMYEHYGIDVTQITDFFRIPMLANEYTEIHLTRYKNGGLSWGSGGVKEGLDADSFGLSTSATQTEEAIYVGFSNRTMNGKRVDTSEIPGGYGIYRLPLRKTEKGQNIPVPEELAIWYPLAEETNFFAIRMNAAGTNLLLFMEEAGMYSMTVIDLATAKPIQKVPMWMAGIPMNGIAVGENFLLILLGDGTIRLWEENPDGTFTKKLDVEEGLEALLPEDRAYMFRYNTSAMDWDGEKLVVGEYYQDNYHRSASFCLAVYRASGLTYFGKYSSSLTTGKANSSSYYCVPHKNLHLSIE